VVEFDCLVSSGFSNADVGAIADALEKLVQPKPGWKLVPGIEMTLVD
jgi:hypothetical protein